MGRARRNMEARQTKKLKMSELQRQEQTAAVGTAHEQGADSEEDRIAALETEKTRLVTELAELQVTRQESELGKISEMRQLGCSGETSELICPEVQMLAPVTYREESLAAPATFSEVPMICSAEMYWEEPSASALDIQLFQATSNCRDRCVSELYLQRAGSVEAALNLYFNEVSEAAAAADVTEQRQVVEQTPVRGNAVYSGPGHSPGGPAFPPRRAGAESDIVLPDGSFDESDGASESFGLVPHRGVPSESVHLLSLADRTHTLLPESVRRRFNEANLPRALAWLQQPGFDEQSCRDALRASDGCKYRALDKLLASPSTPKQVESMAWDAFSTLYIFYTIVAAL